MMTATVPYLDAEGAPFTDEEVAIIERVREDLLSGRSFILVANSARSARGYAPPCTRRAWGHAVRLLGEMAVESDSLAQVATLIVHRLPLYQTPTEAQAHVYEAATEALAAGFDDVIGRSAPDAGRYSAHQRDFTLRERVLLAVWLVGVCAEFERWSSAPRIGWCLAAIARAEGVTTPRRVTEALAR